MNITFLFTYGYSLQTWKNSGTVEKELKILKYLSNRYGFNFTLVTYGDESDLKIAAEFCDFPVLPLYSYVKKSEYKIINYLKSFYLPLKVAKKLKHQDVLHQHQLLGSWVAILLKIILKKPLLIRTGYDMYSFSIYEKKGLHIRFLYRLLTRVTFRFSDIYTVTSKSDESFLKNNLKIGPNKLKIRPNFIEEKKYKKFNERETFKILTVGRLEEQKNYFFLINSLKNLEKWQLDIVGSGTQKKELEKLASNLNVKVNFLGNFEYSQLENLYQDYKFYISTSKYEGNPKTVLEAMSFGCVVLISNIPNHSEIVKHNSNGFLFDFKESEVIKILENEIRNFENLELLSKNASKGLVYTNSLENIAAKMNQDYLEIINI